MGRVTWWGRRWNTYLHVVDAYEDRVLQLMHVERAAFSVVSRWAAEAAHDVRIRAALAALLADVQRADEALAFGQRLAGTLDGAVIHLAAAGFAALHEVADLGVVLARETAVHLVLTVEAQP